MVFWARGLWGVWKGPKKEKPKPWGGQKNGEHWENSLSFGLREVMFLIWLWQVKQPSCIILWIYENNFSNRQTRPNTGCELTVGDLLSIGQQDSTYSASKTRDISCTRHWPSRHKPGWVLQEHQTEKPTKHLPCGKNAQFQTDHWFKSEQKTDTDVKINKTM